MQGFNCIAFVKSLQKSNAKTMLEINDNDYNCKDYNVDVYNLVQYYKSSITVHFKTTDNIYFKCGYLSYDKASFIYHNVLKSKKYCIGVLSMIILLTLGNRISSWVVPDNVIIGDFFVIVSSIISIFFMWSYLLSINLKAVELVSQTFDFWFKLFYAVCWMLSYYVLNVINAANKDDRQMPLWRVALLYCAWVTLCALFFFWDGLYVSVKIKRIVLTVVPLLGLSSAIQRYFVMSTVYWNPFEKYNFEHTTIDFKSLLISSELNIALFIAKPIIADLMRYFRRKICGGRNSNHGNNNNLQSRSIVNSSAGNAKIRHRCTGVYKRPYLEWVIINQTDHEVVKNTPQSVKKNVELGATDEIKLSTVVQ